MKKKTLRTILWRLTVISLIMLTLFGLLFYQLTDRLSRNRSLEYFEGLCVKAEQRVSTYLNEIQRTANLAAYSRSVQTFLFETTAYARVEAQPAATDLLSHIMAFSPGLCEIAFVNQNGNLIQSRGEHTNLMQAVVKERDYIPAGQGGERSFSQVVYDVSSPTDSHTPYFLYVSPVYSVISGSFSASPAATCLLLLRLESLTELLTDSLNVEDVRILLLEQEDLVFASPAPGHPYGDSAVSIPYGTSALSFDGGSSLAFRHDLEDTLWSVEIVAPEAAFSRDLVPIKATILLFLIASILLQSFMLVAGTHQLSVPLKQLLEKIQQIDLTSESRARVPFLQVEEIDILTESINHMLDKIEQVEQSQKETQQKLYQTSLLKNQAQLHYYRSQINPHFLYNTLECISSMARVYRVPYIESICSSMADLFRYSISDVTTVTLRQEVSHAESYFNIISQRTSSRYTLKTDIPEECQEMPMQKMILQPLVENAIKHGLESRDGQCTLLIRASPSEGGGLCLLVADNGLGIPPAKVEKLNAQLQGDGAAPQSASYGGVGLCNISQRLRLAYDGRSRMEISSRYGFYTCIRIWLPPERKDDL